MSRFSLTEEELAEMNTLAETSDDFHILRRIDALRKLDQGWTIEGITELHRVNRRTVYNWKQRFLKNPSLPIIDRLSDRPRSGRPRKTMTQMTRNIDQTLDFLKKHDPEAEKIMRWEIATLLAKWITESDKKSPQVDRGDE